MSIYCSYWDLGNEHSPKCKRVVKVKGDLITLDDTKPCTCGSCPIEYKGSHILPSKSDLHGGLFGISAIPDHITDREKSFKPWKPFLRVHMNQETIIITRQQAEQLKENLCEWLEDAHL